MKNITEIIKKLKNWIIIKLGGYVLPTTKIVHRTLNPVSIYVKHAERYICSPQEIVHKRVLESLSRQIADKIIEEQLCSMETCIDELHRTVHYRMNIKLYENIERGGCSNAKCSEKLYI